MFTPAFSSASLFTNMRSVAPALFAPTPQAKADVPHWKSIDPNDDKVKVYQEFTLNWWEAEHLLARVKGRKSLSFGLRDREIPRAKVNMVKVRVNLQRGQMDELNVQNEATL